MSPPLIGVTTSVTLGHTPERAHVNAAYLRAVQQAGGVPVALPPHLDAPSRDALWRRLDGLLLTGGGDLAPERFGEPPHAAVYDVAPERDALELTLTERALAGAVPVLAICRGIQVLNVALGGSLIQDLPTEVPGPVAHSQTAPREEPTHDVKVMVEGTRLGAVVESAELSVNSFHHQAIKRLGRGLRAVAWAPDGVIEGVDMPDARALVIGVQWHPEDLVGRDAAARRLFSALVQAALAR
ncbi:MAG: gamma-glutamyl-gamma-aminobutyrate hydrolase family protein [Candidatus Rokuibacteriota bacterium]